MISTKQFAAVLGFAFVGVWIAAGFGDAVLCLLGAGIAYAAVAFYQGDLDLDEVQSRLRGEGSGSGSGSGGGGSAGARSGKASSRVR